MNPRQEIERWLPDIVISLSLCPFAAHPWQAGTVRVEVFEGKDEEAFKEKLIDELRLISSTASEKIETTLLSTTLLFPDFFDFSVFVQHSQTLLKREGLKGEIQIASFHPDFQFNSVASGDKQNLTNRSPYPILHLIREASLEKAIESHPDTENIYKRNIALMQALSNDTIKDLFPYSKT